MTTHPPRSVLAFVAGALLWFLSALPGVAQSTINPALPPQGGPLTSAPVRNNFLAAYNDINSLFAMNAAIFSGNHNFTGTIGFLGVTTAVTQSPTDNSTKLATTAFVQSVATAGGITAGTTICNSCSAGGVLYGNGNVQSSAVLFPTSNGFAFNFSGIANNAMSWPTAENTPGASIGLGPFALAGETVAGDYHNIGIGYQVMTSTMTTAATNNNVVGYQSFIFNNTGFDNNVLGTSSLQHNTTGAHNVAIGGSTLAALTTGQGNIGIGPLTMSNMLDGQFNVCIGFASCQGVMTGNSQNVVIGFEAANAITTGAFNIVMGSGSFNLATTAIGNIAIGQQALASVTTSNDGVNCLNGLCTSLAIGNQSLQNFLSGQRNTALGHDSMQALRTGDYNTALGFEAGLFLGGNAGGDCIGFAGVPSTNCLGNTAVGGIALVYSTAGNFNTAVGYNAMFGNGRADTPTFTANYNGQNTSVGASTMRVITNGMNNVALGYLALQSITGVTVAVAKAAPNAVGSGFGTSVSGTMTWSGAGCTTNPVLNVTTTAGGAISTVSSIGTAGVCATVPSSAATTWTAGGSLSAGTGASFTMGFTGGGDGSQNTAIGTNAGQAITVGIQNTILGANMGQNLTTGSGNILIGFGINAAAVGSTNTMNIGNVITATGVNGTAASTVVSFPGTTAATSTSAAAAIFAGGIGVAGSAFFGGNINIPTTAATPVGIITQNGSNFLHTFNSNLFLGLIAGNLTTTGSGGNVGIGSGSLNALTSGIGNTTTGSGNMPKLTTANFNTSMGFNSMVVLTTGSQNTGMGWQSLVSILSGGNNTGFGFNVGSDITTGANNTCFGINACAGLTTGSSNLMVGNYTQSVSTATSANSTTSTVSTTLTLGGNDTTTSWIAGMRLQGACIAGGTTIASVTDSTHVVMTLNGATNSSTCVVSAFSSPGIAYTATTTSTPTFSGTTMTLAGADTVSSLGLLQGMRLTAAGVTAGTTLGACSSATSCTTSTSNSVTGVNATFQNPIGGPGLLTGSNNVIIGRLNIGTLTSPNQTGVIAIATGDAVLHADFNLTNSAAWTFPSHMFFTGLTTATGAQTAYACIASTGQIISVAVANTCATSTEKNKEDIGDLPLGLRELVALRPVAYHYRRTGNDAFDNAPGQREWQMGFIAEEAALVSSRLVVMDDADKPHTVRYEQMTAIVVNALKTIVEACDAAANDNFCTKLKQRMGR